MSAGGSHPISDQARATSIVEQFTPNGIQPNPHGIQPKYTRTKTLTWKWQPRKSSSKGPFSTSMLVSECIGVSQGTNAGKFHISSVENDRRLGGE